MADSPAALLGSLEIGARVVVRYRIEGGFTDALGHLTAHDGAAVTIRTRRGDAVVLLRNVVAAKRVPPPPTRRAREQRAPQRTPRQPEG